MSLNLSMPTVPNELKPRITVIGVGGAGGNAVNNMIRSNLEGVEFIVANTDAQAIAQSICPRKVQLGVNITQGLGAGARPDVGRAAAEEALDEIMENLHGANMVFITAGMGGGTGTGGAPVIARSAREQGILTVGVVTKPFHFEGAHRMRLAESGIEELQQFVDTLLIIPNQNLFRIANEKTTFADAFAMADQVLHSGVRGVTDLMVMPGLINLDFADIRTVMSEMGKAMMGTGEASGENRAVAAAEAAISNPLLDDVSMKGARGVLINITGGYDMTLFEVDEAANRIREEVDPDANIIFGSTFDQSLEGRMRISVVATGIDSALAKARPAQQHTSISLVGRGGRVSSAAAEPHAGESPRTPARHEMRQAEARRPDPRSNDSRNSDSRSIDSRQPEVRLPDPPRSAAPQPAPARLPEPAHAAPVSRAPEATTVSRPPWPEERPAPQPAPAPVYAPEPEPILEPLDELEPDPMELRAVAPEPAQPVYAATARTSEPAPRVERYAEPPPPRAERYAEPAPSRAPEGKRRSGLFARVTGSAAWARQGGGEAREDAPPAPMRGAPAEPQSRSEAPVRFEAVRGEPPARSAAPAPQPRAGSQPAAAQPRLSGLDARERLQPSRSEEDVLDIPAFLRRQAN